jgi:hypothetical protein
LPVVFEKIQQNTEPTVFKIQFLLRSDLHGKATNIALGNEFFDYAIETHGRGQLVFGTCGMHSTSHIKQMSAQDTIVWRSIMAVTLCKIWTKC